jgi:hypothetical protein
VIVLDRLCRMLEGTSDDALEKVECRGSESRSLKECL